MADNVQAVVKSYILTNYLEGEAPENLKPDTELVRSGVLDSLAILNLVNFLEETYDIELDAHDVGPANLGTLESIDRLVRSKMTES